MSDIRKEFGRIRATLVTAELAERPADRYLAAHHAVGQVAAVIIGARADPARPQRRNLWQVVVEIAPELGEWGGYFFALQGKRDAVLAGATALVTSREADDLVRDAQVFADLVERRLESVARSRAG